MIGLIAVATEPVSARTARRVRANGEQSRERILDAATDVASERGYEATTISLVSKHSGLPPASIYWHFADKDDLIAAVIQRSHQRWVQTLDLPRNAGIDDRAAELGAQVARALLNAPHFLRLGLMLAMEQRPVEPRARQEYLRKRGESIGQFADLIRATAPDLDDAAVSLLANYAIAGADGIFIAHEIDSDTARFRAAFELHARLVFGAAIELLRTDDDS